MSEKKAFLEKIHIKNFLSLRDVKLPFKPLTVLVGPNASGKSNTLSALYHLNRIMVDDKFYSNELSKDNLWTGEASEITFQLRTKVKAQQTFYHLEVKPKTDFPFYVEHLSVDNVNVISIQDWQGVILDENGENETTYHSNKPALISAGKYGYKPITRALADFIMKWRLYDFNTGLIRQESDMRFSPAETEIQECPELTVAGENLVEVLWNWYKNSPDSFQNVNDSLAANTNREIDYRLIDGRYQLFMIEGDENLIPMKNASDGILRLIAYNILRNEPKLPPLIAIEEPERNLHPDALSDIAHVLEQIAQYSQVIITTHSSRLLDAFDPVSLSDSLGVLLLQNRPGFGTEAKNLEEYSNKGEALAGWMADFGIGSAIFDSGLLPDEMEDKPEYQA